MFGGCSWHQSGDLFVSQYGRSTITVLRDTHGDGKPNIEMIYASGSASNDAIRRHRATEVAVVVNGNGPSQAGQPSHSRMDLGGQPFLARPTQRIASGDDRDPEPNGDGIFNADIFYVANTDSIVRYKYTPRRSRSAGDHRKLSIFLRADSMDGATSSSIAPAPKLYVTVGSASNNRAGEIRRAAILEMNPDGTGLRIFASGSANPEKLAWQPGPRYKSLLDYVNERDPLGDDLCRIF